ncbi:MAG TPA: MFS transporter [Polyangia bacterium]
MMRLLPASAGGDARILLVTRVVRGFSDGVVAVVLASYLTALGLSPLRVGAIVTGTMLGSAALTLAVGLWGGRFSRRRLLVASCALMLATGLGFAGATSFWPLFVVAVVGTLNPSAGDVSVFLPTEQAVLSQSAAPRDRTALFAWYNLCGSLAGAAGALASALPAWLAHRRHVELHAAERWVFVVYGASAIVAALFYRRLSAGAEVSAAAPSSGLARSRAVVLRLAALFSLDSLGGGFVVQSLLVLWLARRFGLSPTATGELFFVAGICAAFSQLVSSRLAAQIGLIETMVYTHLPANLLLVLAGVVPSVKAAVACLLLRMCLSNMDVPARQSYVMAVVPPDERAAAASVTNVPRSLAAALTPVVAGWMLERSTFGWPLVCAGVSKAIYDLLLLAQFKQRRPQWDA